MTSLFAVLPVLAAALGWGDDSGTTGSIGEDCTPAPVSEEAPEAAAAAARRRLLLEGVTGSEDLDLLGVVRPLPRLPDIFSDRKRAKNVQTTQKVSNVL